MSAMKLPCPYCHRCRKELSDGWQYCENCPWHFVNRSWCKKIEQSGSSIGNSTYIVSVSAPLQRRQSQVWYYLKITCDTLKIPQESKKRPSCWEKNERKRLMKLTTMIWKKNGSSLTSNARMTRWFSIPTQAGNCNKPDCQRRWHFVIYHSMVSSNTFQIYVSNIMFVLNCTHEIEIDEYSFCNICQYKERIFKGPNTRDKFCKWLFL